MRLGAQFTLVGCWAWQGARNRDGYGVFRVGRPIVYASGFAYELVGPIPAGFEFDFEPPVSDAENLWRARLAREVAA